MTEIELVKRLAVMTESPRSEVRALLAALAATVDQELSEGRHVRIPGIGALVIKRTPARSGIGPFGQPWSRPERGRLAFQPLPWLKAKVNK